MDASLSNNITIAQIEPADIPTLVRFQSCMAKETERRDLDNITVTNFFNSIVSENSYGKYFVAKSSFSGESLGCTMATHAFEFLNGQLSVWIQSVYVDAPHRGKGVFRALFDFVLEYSKQLKADKVYLYVDKHNKKAQSIYESMGMVQSSRFFFEKDFFFDYKVKDLIEPRKFSFSCSSIRTKKNINLDSKQLFSYLKSGNEDDFVIKTKEDGFNWLRESLLVEVWTNQGLVGVMVGFVELSDWTNGINTCISDFYFVIDEFSLKSMIDEFENFITSTDDLGYKTTSLRFMMEVDDEEKKRIMSIIGYDYQQFILYQTK